MEAQTLQAEVREKSGKGPARQLRARGLIPAIYYGRGVESQKLAVSASALERALRSPYGRNQLIELDINGEKKLTLVRDLAINPVDRRLRHADFYAVTRDRKVDAWVSFETTGRSIGVQKGGFLTKLYRELPVRGFPQDIPAQIVLDVGSLDIGAIVTVKDLAVPQGVEIAYPGDRRVLLVEMKQRRGAEEEGEGEASAEGEKG